MKKRIKVLVGILAVLFVTGFMCSGIKADAANDEHVLDNGLVVKYNSSNETSGADVIGYVGDKPDVVIPEYIGQHYVDYICESAFEDNKVIQSVVIPQSVSRICKKAFKNCVNLKSVIFEGNHLEWLAQRNKSKTPMCIWKEAFYGCTSLEYIEFTHGFDISVDSEKDMATIFAGSGLKAAKVDICSGWTSIGGIFNNCPDLERIDVDFAGVEKMGGRTVDVHFGWIADIPNLKEINLYNLDKIRLLTNLSYYPDGEKRGYGDRIFNCPKLEAINLYFNEPGNNACSLARNCALISSNMSVAETSKNSNPSPDDYGYDIKVVDYGTATISSSNGMIDYVFNVIVGDGIGNKKNISDAKVELPLDSFNYMGSEIIPCVFVSYDGTALVENTDYTVTAKNNVEIGTAKLIISGKGEFAGEVEKEFSIIPVTTVIKSVESSKTKYTITWNANPQASGYEIRYSKKKSSGYKKLTATTKFTITSDKLKSGMYIKIRTYKTVDGQKIYSEYSKPIKIK